MILLFDIGNSNIVLGLAENEKIIKTYRYESLTTKTFDEYYLSMKETFKDCNIEGVILCSVVPILTSTIKKMVKNHLNIEPLIVGTGLKTGIEIKCNNPKEVGADIVAAAVGAYVKYQKSSLIVDLGTANKIIYQKQNVLKGVIIAPGVKTSLLALTENTALLPNIEMVVPKKVLGNNTIECMQSGITYGVAASIDGLIKRVKEEINDDVILIATGGLSKLIIPLCEDKYIIDDNLILHGLLHLYKKQNDYLQK